MSDAAALVFRPATRAGPSAVLALPADEERAGDPAAIEVTEAFERAFAAVEQDPRNELPVPSGAGTGTVVGRLQATYIPGPGKGGAERAPVEAVRIRADRRGGGLGRSLRERAVARARARGWASGRHSD